MELTLYAQNNTNFLSNGSKMHSGFKLVYSTNFHKRSELFKYFSGLQCIAQKEKLVEGELLEAAYLGTGARLMAYVYF